MDNARSFCVNSSDKNDNLICDISHIITKNRHFYKRSTFILSIKTFRFLK